MRTPEEEADSLVADMKEKAPPRRDSLHLSDDKWVRDIGFGSIVLHQSGKQAIILGRDEVAKLVEYIAHQDPEAL